eukprot:5516317-Pyramimonas_sp.AAC.1
MVCKTVQTLLANTLTHDTNSDTFGHLEVLHSEASRTTGNQSVTRIAAQAMLTSAGDFWQKKIDWANDRAKAIQEHGGSLQGSHSKLMEMPVGGPPTKAN